MDLQGDVGETERSRGGGEVITPPFEAVWPDVERRLKALLYRRGLDSASSDDVVQEVALRALAGRVTYTSAKDLLRWAGPVACNLHVDLLRQRARLYEGDVGDVDDEHPATHDVAGEVADRMELQRAFRGIARLRPADREAIMAAVAAEPVAPRNRKEAVRLAVRRHRARNRLALVLEQLAIWPFAWRWTRPSRGTVAVALAAVPIGLPLVLGLRPPGPAGTTTPPAPPPAAASRTSPFADVAQAPATAVPEPAGPAPAVPRAARAATTPSPRAPIVEVEAPNGVAGATFTGRDREEDDGTVCLRDLVLVEDICV